MGIEDELRARANAKDAAEKAHARNRERWTLAHDASLGKAMLEVRQIAAEATKALIKEGLKPAKLSYIPKDAKRYPVLEYALSTVQCGYGFHVIKGVVVGTDGQLWKRGQGYNPTPQKELGWSKLVVSAPKGKINLPSPLEFDGVTIYTSRRVSEEDYERLDFLEQLKDGYAELLRFHRARRR